MYEYMSKIEMIYKNKIKIINQKQTVDCCP